METAEELKPEWFNGIGKVGITAGASTPQWLIDDVIERIEEIDKTLEEAISAMSGKK